MHHHQTNLAIISFIAKNRIFYVMTESLVTANGVIFANYKRAGAVRTGTVGE